MRLINEVHEGIRAGYGWDYTALALKFGADMDAERLKKHYDNDSPNSYILARLNEVYNLPTLPSEEFLNGEVNRFLKRNMLARGWNYRELSRRMLPKSPELGRFTESVEKFFINVSTDAWKIARMCEVFKVKTLPADWFLNQSDRVEMNKKHQLELAI